MSVENEGLEQARPSRPIVQHIAVSDLFAALRFGVLDFFRAPIYGLFFAGIYAVGGWGILYFLSAYDVPFMVYPMAAGFALIAPFVAAGLYDVSRRLEQSEPLSFRTVLGSVWRRSGRDLGWMALVTTFAFLFWVDMAGILYLIFFGLEALDIQVLLEKVTTTSDGLLFLVMGNAAGFLLSAVVFSITVISFPLLVDRDVDFITAMIASVRSVTENLTTMFVWYLMIGALLAVSILSVFAGLLIILPVLGHASWHVYRKVIVPSE